jgi:hypothetical protein
VRLFVPGSRLMPFGAAAAQGWVWPQWRRRWCPAHLRRRQWLPWHRLPPRRYCSCIRRRVHAATLGTPSSPRDDAGERDVAIATAHSLCAVNQRLRFPYLALPPPLPAMCSTKCPACSNFVLKGLHAKH